MGLIQNTVQNIGTGLGHVGARVNQSTAGGSLARSASQRFSRSYTTNISQASRVCPILSESRNISEGIAQGEFSKTVANTSILGLALLSGAGGSGIKQAGYLLTENKMMYFGYQSLKNRSQSYIRTFSSETKNDIKEDGQESASREDVDKDYGVKDRDVGFGNQINADSSLGIQPEVLQHTINLKGDKQDKEKEDAAEEHQCNKGHPTKKLFEQPQFYVDKYGHGKVGCNQCGQKIEYKDGIEHCQACEEDYCLKCGELRADGTITEADAVKKEPIKAAAYVDDQRNQEGTVQQNAHKPESRKILVTGSSGFVGDYVINELASRYEDLQIVGMSRTGNRRFPIISNYNRNISYHEGNCLFQESYEELLDGVDGCIHTVSAGPISDTRDYPNRTYAATNYKSAITIARALNEVATAEGTIKNFVMISNDKLPIFGKDIETKLAAEQLIKDECPNLNLYCVRPGLIWSTRDRKWTYFMKFPMNLLSNIGDKVGKVPLVNNLEFLFPAHTTQISTVGHYAIEAVMGNLDPETNNVITNQTLNEYEQGIRNAAKAKFEAAEALRRSQSDMKKSK